MPRTAVHPRLSIVAVSVTLLAAAAVPAQAAPGPRPGPLNAITDVDGVEVGHFTDTRNITGTSVVLTRGGAQVGVDVRGGAPGTLNTDALDPVADQSHFHGLFLSGGSWMGLSSYDGVVQRLREEGTGYVYAEGKTLPAVGGAILYDLDQGADTEAELERTPGTAAGYAAVKAAKDGPVAQGNVGGGTGAGTAGPGSRMKGGVGTASIELEGGVTIGAYVVVNSLGRAYNTARDCELNTLHLEVGDEFGDVRTPPEGCATGGAEGDRPDTDATPPQQTDRVDENTTIGVIATNAELTAPEAQKLAQVGHDGLARSLTPAHTMADGDAIFGMSTREGPRADWDRFNAILDAAPDVFSRAVDRAVLNAEPLGGRKTYCQTFAGACPDRTGQADTGTPAEGDRAAAAPAGPRPPSTGPAGLPAAAGTGDRLALLAVLLAAGSAVWAVRRRLPRRRTA